MSSEPDKRIKKQVDLYNSRVFLETLLHKVDADIQKVEREEADELISIVDIDRE
jgi:5-bromo-4-chloroindolyl phosphate hydrolysis protein